MGDSVRMHCWWCCHPWEGQEVHLPIRYDDRTKKFTSIGHFCSFECAKAYGIDSGGARWGEILENLSLMRKHAYGKYTPLWPAPKRQTLKIFGGPLSIDEFRKCGGNAPWVHVPGDIHMVHTFGSRADEKIMGTDNATTAGPSDDPNELKLKRTKPLKRTASKLESALGITRRKT